MALSSGIVPFDPLKKPLEAVQQPLGQPAGSAGLQATIQPQVPAQQPAVRTAQPGPQPGAGQPALPQGMGYNMYGSGGGTSAQTQAGSLESGLRDYITKGLGGVTSKQFIDRSKQQLGASTEGQRASAVNSINDDAIRRGMFKSGVPAEATAAAGRAAQGSFASGLADILKGAEQQDMAGRESAANQASSLLGANRSMDQYTQQRIDQERAQRAAAAANAPKSFTYIDPDTGQSYQMSEEDF
jgi:hypothetical protein